MCFYFFISSHRTKVIDDESDYFSVDANRWLSDAERDSLSKKEAEMREAKYASRRDRKIVLDFAGRRVIEQEDTVGKGNFLVNKDITSLFVSCQCPNPQVC